MPTLSREDIANLTNLLGITGAQSTYGTPEDLTPGPSPTAALSALLGGSNPSTRVVDPGAVAPPTTSYDFGGGRTGSFKGISQGTAATPYEQEQTATANAARAQDLANAEKGRQALNDLFLPGGAQDIANRASQRKMQEEAVGPTIAGQTARDIEGMKAATAAQIAQDKLDAANNAPIKLNQQEQRTVDSAHAVNDLGLPLLQRFEARYPGIGANPRQYGSPLSDTLTEKLGKGIYSFGGMTDRDELFQEVAAIQAWAIQAQSAGRLTKPIMEMLQSHLPQAGYSPGANYTRLKTLIHELLPAQLQGISDAHGGTPLTLGTGASSENAPTADPYANPNWGR